MAPHPSSKTLIRGTGIVAALTLLSRFFGFIRDLLVARLFGASAIADAFYVAFRIPNLLRSFVAEGALTAAFVPVFSSELKHGHDHAQRAVSAVTTLMILVTIAMSVLGIIFAPEIVDLFAPGFRAHSEKAELCVTLTRIMFPYIIFVSLVAMLNGALNSVKIFGIAAFAQVIMNIVLIAGVLVAAAFDEREAAYVLAISVVVGGIAQVVAQIPALRRSGFSLRLTRNFITATTREVGALMVPALIGATVYQISIFLSTVFASLLESGSVSWLFYADRLTQLPIGIFSVALASVLLPALSRAQADNDQALFRRNLVDALRYTSFFIIPTATIIFVLAEPLIQIIFERGAFTHVATMQTALAVQAYAIGLWAVSCYSLVVRAFIARKDTRIPTCIGMIMLAISVTLTLLFMGPPAVSDQSWFFMVLVSAREFVAAAGSLFGVAQAMGHAGLALASSLSSILGLALAAWLLHRRIEGLDWKPFIAATIRALLASGVMAAMLIYLPIGGLPLWGRLAAELALAAAVFLGVSALIKNAELSETFALILRYVNRTKPSPP